MNFCFVIFASALQKSVRNQRGKRAKSATGKILSNARNKVRCAGKSSQTELHGSRVQRSPINICAGNENKSDNKNNRQTTDQRQKRIERRKLRQRRAEISIMNRGETHTGAEGNPKGTRRLPDGNALFAPNARIHTG